jgi:CheY-like chemotaxis protein
MNNTMSAVDVQKFVIRCHQCRTAFDVFEATWCDCLVREPSIKCPACGECFCKAAQAYKVGFWAMAPASLYGRRLRELRQDDKATGQKALASLHLQRAAFGAPLVLVVDDSRTVRMVAARTLSELGCEVLEAIDAEEALAIVGSHHPDLVLTDALMPKLDGREMCRMMKSDVQTADIAVVLMTGLYTALRYKTEALSKFGADAYLTKPVQPAQLKEVLHKFVPRSVMTRRCA